MKPPLVSASAGPDGEYTLVCPKCHVNQKLDSYDCIGLDDGNLQCNLCFSLVVYKLEPKTRGRAKRIESETPMLFTE